MKLCDTCIYRNNVEQLKPCIIYRDDCEFYEKERGDMTREEAIHILNSLKPTNTKSSFDAYVVGKAITMAIKALEHPKQNVVAVVPCGDAISRQAVLEMAYDMSEIDGEHFTEPCMVVDVEDIQKLPPVNPQEPKTGHWIEHNAKCYECSECHNNKSLYASYKTDYCPDCGARMESEE